MGWPAFLSITPNIKEEGAMKEDSGMQDTPYNEVSNVNIYVPVLYWQCVISSGILYIKTNYSEWQCKGMQLLSELSQLLQWCLAKENMKYQSWNQGKGKPMKQIHSYAWDVNYSSIFILLLFLVFV